MDVERASSRLSILGVTNQQTNHPDKDGDKIGAFNEELLYCDDLISRMAQVDLQEIKDNFISFAVVGKQQL